MKFKSFRQLAEELTNVQKRQVDSWGPNTRATEISKHVFPEGHDRIEIPLAHSNTPVESHPDVQSHLKQHGYEVKDYVAGTAKDKHGRDVKIGKALEKTKAPDALKNTFANDPNRAAKKAGDLKVVISKHPHDVAGMSTDRGWSSCMNMKGGCNRHYLKQDVKHGTHVAYLVHKDDNDIKKPLARIALKPYPSVDTKHTILRPEELSYGTGDSAFHDTVNKFAEKHYPAKDAMYKKDSKVYDDRGDKEDNMGVNPVVIGDLDKAATHKFKDVRKEAASHPNLTKEHINKLINDPDVEVRKIIASHPDLTKEHLDKLVNDKNPSVRGKVLQHPNATKEHVNKILDDPDDYVRANIARLPDLPQEHIDKLMNDPSLYVRRVVAHRPDITKEHIAKLVNDEDPLIRENLAENPNITKEQVNKLVNDPEKDVRKAIAFHPDLTKEHIDKLVSDPVERVRETIARHPNLTDEHINKLVDDPEKDVRASIARHSKLSKAHIDKLVSDPHHYVRAIIALHPNLTDDHIDKLSGKESVEV